MSNKLNILNKIIDCKYEKGQPYYLVKWKPSWEPADKLEPLFQDYIEDFWERINICKDAKDGILRPPRKRKRIEDHSTIAPTINGTDFTQPTQNNNTSQNNFTNNFGHHVSGQPMMQTPNQPQHINQHHHQQAQQNQPQPQPQLQHSMNQLMGFTDQQNMAAGVASNLFQTGLPSPGGAGEKKTRGRGRGRGSKGRGGQGRGGMSNNIQQQQPQQQMMQNDMQNYGGGMGVSPFGMMSPAQSPGAFNFDTKPVISQQQQQQHQSLQDIKPTIGPGGVIVDPYQQHQQISQPQPIMPGGMTFGDSPRGKGRGGGGRGRGRSSSTGGVTPIKEEFKGEPVAGEELRTINKTTSGVPNLLSGDGQYDNWSNPYAKLALVCRMCTKEQNPKSKATWKQHWESHTDLKNFGCYSCEKRFRMKGDLKTHIVRVHKEDFIDERVIRYNETAPIPQVDPSEIIDGWSNPYVRNVFRCLQCNKELQWKNRASWKIHYESHLDIKRFGCYVCQKPFRLKGDLKTHITRVHKIEFDDLQVIKLDQN
eukprot:TCONS_00059921-protein